MSEPNYQHSCVHCVFIGQGAIEKKAVDWYICRQFSDPHIVCRFSSNSYWERSIGQLGDRDHLYTLEASKVIRRKEAQAIIKKED